LPPSPPPPPRYADGPKYYSDPKMFSIQLDPYTPPPTYDPATADEEAQVQLHAAAVLHQLSQLYVGMALAALLGRVFVMPPLQCYCWSSGASGRPQYNCRAAGDFVSALPFTCTLDQVRCCCVCLLPACFDCCVCAVVSVTLDQERAVVVVHGMEGGGGAAGLVSGFS
jgi:hypothetical protein